MGTIALDIDGTITGENHLIPDTVVSFLQDLYQKGWNMILVTGRSFSFAFIALKKLSFPYYLALQNGADLLQMPERKRVGQAYLSMKTVRFFEQFYEGKNEDFILYAGYEKGDFCYFRPQRFSKEFCTYFQKIKRLSTKKWQVISSFTDIKEQMTFPLIKCFGDKSFLEALDIHLQSMKEIKSSMIRDPLKKGLYIILVTDKNADKGLSVKKFMKIAHWSRPLIVAGDDNNDILLLKEGDIKIAMEDSPQALLALADIVAPPSTCEGILYGLTQALEKVSFQRND